MREPQVKGEKMNRDLTTVKFQNLIINTANPGEIKIAFVIDEENNKLRLELSWYTGNNYQLCTVESEGFTSPLNLQSLIDTMACVGLPPIVKEKLIKIKIQNYAALSDDGDTIEEDSLYIKDIEDLVD
jgi:hypothetical protein